MLWFVYAILGAITSAVYYALIKKYLKNIDQLVLSGGVFICCSAMLFALSFARGIPTLGEDFMWSVIASSILNILAAYLSFKALKLTDLSLAMPMISFTPLFMIGTSFLILNELPSQAGIIGIIIIVAGSYVLNTTNSTKLLDPLKEMFQNRGVMLMLTVGFIYSFTANFDKVVVLNSDAYFSGASVIGIMGLFFLALTIKKQHLKNYKAYILPAVALSLSGIFVNTAFQMEIAPYVISIKRLSILFGVLIGGLLFKEDHLPRRLTGAAIMAVGVVCILLL